MEEILVNGSRMAGFAAERRRTVAWAAAIGVLLVAVLVVAKARQPAPVVAAPSVASTAAATPEEPRVYVHVAGAVAKPGLYRFPEGMRVADAIETAGGPMPKADLDAINLADVLIDGMKIEVPTRGEAVSSVASPSASAGPVNLNTADQIALETIPGVGPVTATAIIQHRTEIGGFETVETLLDVTGIGPATLEALRPYVTV